MNKKTVAILPMILFLLAGILFIISALIGNNYIFIAIGCCFIILSITFGMQYKFKKNDKTDENDASKE